MCYNATCLESLVIKFLKVINLVINILTEALKQRHPKKASPHHSEVAHVHLLALKKAFQNVLLKLTYTLARLLSSCGFPLGIPPEATGDPPI